MLTMPDTVLRTTKDGWQVQVRPPAVWKAVGAMAGVVLGSGLLVGHGLLMLRSPPAGVPAWGRHLILLFHLVFLLVAAAAVPTVGRWLQWGRVEVAGGRLRVRVKGVWPRRWEWKLEEIADVSVWWGFASIGQDDPVVSHGETRLRVVPRTGRPVVAFSRYDGTLIALARALRAQLKLPDRREAGRAWLAQQHARQASTDQDAAGRHLLAYGTQPPGRVSCDFRPDGLSIHLPPGLFSERALLELDGDTLRLSGFTSPRQEWPAGRIIAFRDSSSLAFLLDDGQTVSLPTLLGRDERRWIAYVLSRALGLPAAGKSRELSVP